MGHILQATCSDMKRWPVGVKGKKTFAGPISKRIRRKVNEAMKKGKGGRKGGRERSREESREGASWEGNKQGRTDD